MTGSVEQLTQKLASLDRQTDELKAKLDQTYGGYIQVLVRVFQQQVLQACYHICTEGYPQEFVALSMTQRHDLQQRIQKITKTTAGFISEILLFPPPILPPVQMPGFFSMTPEQFMGLDGDELEGDQDQEDDEDETYDEVDDGTTSFTLDLTDPSVLADFAPGLASSQRSAIEEILGDVEEMEEIDLDDDDDEEDDEDDDDDDDDDDDTPFSRAEPGRRRMTEADARELQAILSQVAAAISAKEPKTPVDRVLSWQDSIEHAIREQICLASYQVNQALQKAQLIPPQVPDRALEAASRANGDGATKISHVIQMLVELGNASRSRDSQNGDSESSNSSNASSNAANDRDSTDRNASAADPESADTDARSAPRKKQSRPLNVVPKLTHVIALQVRLSEIEFHDPLLMRWRRNIRELSLELQTLTRDYRNYQRKLSVAEAQVAWRSTWLSDR
jgi:hypothetical protein